jgi:hypothetical protein
VGLACVAALGANGPRFFPDDPLQVDDDRAIDASAVQPTRVVGLKDLVSNTFREVGDHRDVEAMNVNSLGDVPDSSWFTNRIGRAPMTPGALARGPNRFMTLSIDGWPIVEGKGEGLQPGLRVRDPEGHLYQVKFDPRRRPDMSTAAEIIGTAFFHAFGYRVPEVYLVEFDPEQTVIAEGAVIRDGGGRERRLVKKDIEDTLAAAARLPNGRYRGVASRFIEGEPLGGFRYWGTRPDDPNDIVPHEHRRELRALRVFAAWLNHDEADSTNTFDTLVRDGGRAWVEHYLIDFGSLLGSDTTRQQRGRSGNEYLLEWGPGLRTAATLGFYLRPWLRVDYPEKPASIGRFESEFFEPLEWRPVYANPAFDNMRPDDAFWAARIVSRFDEAGIRAIVGSARYADPAATEYVARTILERQRKVLRAWLTGVNPVADVTLGGDGRLAFVNAAAATGVAAPATRYRLSWFLFDNATGGRTPVGDEQLSSAPEGRLPAALTAHGGYVGVSIATEHPEYTGWARPVTVFFRRGASGWEAVGLER